MTQEQLQWRILSFATARWRKVAFIVGQIMIDDGYVAEDDFNAAFAALIAAGMLDVAGDHRQWGYSEVRLPPIIGSDEAP